MAALLPDTTVLWTPNGQRQVLDDRAAAAAGHRSVDGKLPPHGTYTVVKYYRLRIHPVKGKTPGNVLVIFDEAGKKCEEILLEHRELLISVAEYLLENESMEGEDFASLCKNGFVAPRAKPQPKIEPLNIEEIFSEKEINDWVQMHLNVWI